MRDLETGTLEIDGKTCADCRECCGFSPEGRATCLMKFANRTMPWVIPIDDPACRYFKPRPVDMTLGS